MGFFDTIGNAIGDVTGGLTGGIAKNNSYQAANPYSPEAFQQALANSNQVYQQQQALAQALLAQSQGQGPNPALLQLQQTTDQNNQQAAGLLASQRGLNPALAARLAAQTQTTANQEAGGQAATLGARQQLAATGELGNLYGTIGNQSFNQQQLINQANYNTTALNAGVAAQNSGQQFKLEQGLLNSAGGAAAGGATPSGGGGATMTPAQESSLNSGQYSQLNTGGGDGYHLASGGKVPGQARVSGDSSKNDTVPTMLSPGEIVIPRSHSQNASMAKDFIDALMSEGKKKKGINQSSFGKVLEAHRNLSKALEAVKGK